MKLTYPKALAILGFAIALCIAIPIYLDSRIPRATTTIQIHPSSLVQTFSNNPKLSDHHFME